MMQPHYRVWQLSYWSQTWREMPLQQRKMFGIAMLIHCILSAWFISRQGVTFDEPDYFAYVFEWAQGHPERNKPLMDSKTPILAVSLLPAIFKPLLPDAWLANDMFFYLKAGRPFIYLYQLLGAFVVASWIYRIAGPKRWLLPLLFYVFDPLVFSYGMLIGSDLVSAALLITVMYTAWRYHKTVERKYWLMMAVAAALAVVAKASMLYCYPLLLLLFIGMAIARRTVNIKQAVIRLLLFAVIQLVIINLAYYGKGTFTAMGRLPFESNAFSELQETFSFMNFLPVPLPTAFIQGLDMLQQHAEIGGCKENSTYYGVWLFDKVYCDRSLWYYYIVTAVYKVPLLVWLFIVVAVVRVSWGKNMLHKLAANIFLWLPFMYFLFILSFANKFQIGIRHAMILMPFLYIGIANTIDWMYERKKIVFYSLTVLHLAGIIRYWPNIMAYTNELLWNKTTVYKVIRDSSLDYGQSNPWVKTFVDEHPGYQMPTTIPAPGKFAITVADLYNDHEGRAKDIAWLRNNFQPDGNYRYTILLFTVTENDVKRLATVNQ